MLEQYILHASYLSSIYTPCFILEQYILHASCLSSIYTPCFILEQYILHASCLSSIYTPCFILEQYILHASCLSSIYTPCFMLEQYIVSSAIISTSLLLSPMLITLTSVVTCDLSAHNYISIVGKSFGSQKLEHTSTSAQNAWQIFPTPTTFVAHITIAIFIRHIHFNNKLYIYTVNSPVCHAC